MADGYSYKYKLWSRCSKGTGIKKSGETLVIPWVGEEVQIHACDFTVRRQAIGLNFSPIRQTATLSCITVVH
jgi:hypothetical protein